MGARDYIVTAEERRRTGKTTEEIIGEREAANKKDTVSKSSGKVKATKGAREVLQQLGRDNPDSEYAHYATDEYETVQTVRATYTPTVGEVRREREAEASKTRSDKTVIVTGKAAEAFNRLSQEQQQAMLEPNTSYVVQGVGESPSASTRYYRVRGSQTYVAQQLQSDAVLSARQKRQLREAGYTQDRTGTWRNAQGDVIKIDAEQFKQAVRQEEITRARQRDITRERESGRMSSRQLGALQRDINADVASYNKRIERERKDAAIQRNKEQREREQAIATQEPFKARQPRDFSEAAFMAAEREVAKFEAYERAEAPKMERIRGTANILTQLFSPMSAELIYNKATKGRFLVDEGSRNKFFQPEVQNIVASGFLGSVFGLKSIGTKAYAEQKIMAYSMLSNPYGSLKSQIAEAPKPFTSKEPRYQAFRDTFNPLKPKGQATYISAAIGAVFLGTTFKNIRSSAPRAATTARFEQSMELKPIYEPFGASTKFQPIAPSGVLKPVSAPAILKAVDSGKYNIQVNFGQNLARPVGWVRWGHTGRISRYDFINPRTGQINTTITQRGIFGTIKETEIIRTPSSTNPNVMSVWSQTFRHHPTIGNYQIYKPQTYTTPIPKIFTDNYISNVFKTGDYKIIADKTLFQKQYSLFEYKITARNVNARYYYNKSYNPFTKQYINIKQQSTIYKDIFSRPTQIKQQPLTHSIFKINQPNKEFVMTTRLTKYNTPTLTNPKLKIGDLSFPKDRTYLTGSGTSFDFTSGGSLMRGDWINFLKITDKRLIREVYTGTETATSVKYTTASRIPDFFKAAKNNPYVSRFLFDQSGSGRLAPSFQVLKPTQTLTVPVSQAPIVPNLGISPQSLLPLSMFSQSQRIAPVIGLPQFAPPIQRVSKITPTQRLINDQLTAQISIQNTIPILRSQPIQRLDLFQKQKQATQELSIFDSATITRQDLRQKQALDLDQMITPISPVNNGGFTPILPTITPPPDVTPPPSLFFPLEPQIGKQKGGKRGRKPYKKKYAPSLIGLDFNIKAPKGFNPKSFIGSGLGVRPIF